MAPAAGERIAEVPAQTQWFMARLKGGPFLMLVPLFSDDMAFSLEQKESGMLLLWSSARGWSFGRTSRLYCNQGFALSAFLQCIG
jgi:hypothetical protein